MTKMSPAWPFGFAFLISVLAFWFHLNYVMLTGFPDHHITELAGAEEKLARWFNKISIGVALWLIYLGIVSFHAQARRRVQYTAALYLTIMIISFAIDQYFRLNLDNGAGG